MKKITVIGISDNRRISFSNELLDIIKSADLLAGGKRHKEIVCSLIGESYNWSLITIPLQDFFDSLRYYSNIVVFASGDPLFYGIANTIISKMPDAKVEVYPYFNSLQILCHRSLISYGDIKYVSLTGRDWDMLDLAVMDSYDLIGVLTDKKKGPCEIAQRLLYYGYNNYDMIVGENLENKDKEKVKRFELSDNIFLKRSIECFDNPNVVLLKKIRDIDRGVGLIDSDFHLLDNRESMITKWPIRLSSISMLELKKGSVLWDIGGCTGSISIEAKLIFKNIKVICFEKREFKDIESSPMVLNMRKFGAMGITTIFEDFLECKLDSYTPPDSVFIGGHGGKLKDMLRVIYKKIKVGGVVVFNSVSASSASLFREVSKDLGFRDIHSMDIQIDNYNKITILKAKR